MPPAPRGDADQVGMNRIGEGRRRAGRAQAADDPARLRERGAEAAQLGGDERLEEALTLEQLLGVRDESVLVVVHCGLRFDGRGEAVDCGSPIDGGAIRKFLALGAWRVLPMDS